MSMTRIGRVSGSAGRLRTLGAKAAALAAVGVLGAVPTTVAAASSQAPDWTKQDPATSPPELAGAPMAYDAATGTAVLFSGTPRTVIGHLEETDQTWTWDGTTWTKQDPAVHPFKRSGASMAYDAATSTAVLFGGSHTSHFLNQTWTWNGTTWTKQVGGIRPSPRTSAAMTYDPATGNVVLFGGWNGSVALGDTWTWNGATWTKQDPATSPPAREDASMTYDAATGNVVLFGGATDCCNVFNDTWTWNGTTWTQQAPTTSPRARYSASMTYDPATGNAVLFGGFGVGNHSLLGDTWTWDGTTWTQQTPATIPPARYWASMVYDAATGNVVLFGGIGRSGHFLRDTWTWG